MPVVRLYKSRFSRMVGADRKKIIDRLPFLGLDMESVEKDSVRVEYSPNRPDFGTDFGIARAMRGALGKEVGLPKFQASPSGWTVKVDRRLGRVRPFIACATVTGLVLDDEDIRQIISLQEDLHNGLGRRRKAVAIGLHDMDAIAPPFSYHAVGADFQFTPLGGKGPSSVGSILSDTEEGRLYGPALGDGWAYPIISDSKGTVLSFPPVINGEATKVTRKTRRIFIDVTSMDEGAGDDVLAIMATTLAEAGGTIGTVSVRYPGKLRKTPDLRPSKLPLDVGLVRTVLGMDLTQSEVARSLRKSRLEVKGKLVLVPRYRVDLMHPVDLAEEVGLGYGFDRIGPVYPASTQPGSFDSYEEYLDSVSTLMAGMGMIELMTFELTDASTLYTAFGRPRGDSIQVADPKSSEHSVLRDAVIPSIMAALKSNVRSDYPQRVFEIGRVYARSGASVAESMHLACLVAHSQSSFTEAKSFIESLCITVGGVEVSARKSDHWAFIQGRCAALESGGLLLGHVGEIRPEVIETSGLNVPVSGFEIDLGALYERLK